MITERSIRTAKTKVNQCTLRQKNISSYLQKVGNRKYGFDHHGIEKYAMKMSFPTLEHRKMRGVREWENLHEKENQGKSYCLLMGPKRTIVWYAIGNAGRPRSGCRRDHRHGASKQQLPQNILSPETGRFQNRIYNMCWFSSINQNVCFI